MTSTRTIVDYQLLLTIFLAVLLWFFCARLAKLRIFRAPEFMAMAFLIAVLGLLVHLLLGANANA